MITCILNIFDHKDNIIHNAFGPGIQTATTKRFSERNHLMHRKMPLHGTHRSVV